MNCDVSSQHAKKGGGEQMGVIMECKYSIWTEYGWGAIMHNTDL